MSIKRFCDFCGSEGAMERAYIRGNGYGEDKNHPVFLAIEVLPKLLSDGDPLGALDLILGRARTLLDRIEKEANGD